MGAGSRVIVTKGGNHSNKVRSVSIRSFAALAQVLPPLRYYPPR